MPARPQQNDARRRDRYPNPYGLLVRRPGDPVESAYLPTAPAVITAGLNAYGVWVTVGAPLGRDFWVSQFYGSLLTIPANLSLSVIETGYGPANPPAFALDALRFSTPFVDPALDASGSFAAASLVPYLRIPAAQQVYARAFCNDAAVARTYETLLAGFLDTVPQFTVLPTHLTMRGPGRFYPSNSTSLNTVSGVLPAFGAYLSAVTAAPNDMLVTEFRHGLLATGVVLTAMMMYQVAIGPAGMEVPVASVISARGGGGLAINPPVWLRAGERLAIRVGATGGGTKAIGVKVYDLDRP